MKQGKRKRKEEHGQGEGGGGDKIKDRQGEGQVQRKRWMQSCRYELELHQNGMASVQYDGGCTCHKPGY